MRELTIGLSDDLAAFAAESAAQRGFASTEDFLRAVLREMQQIDALRVKIDEGYAAPTSIRRFDDAFFANLRQRIDSFG